ncbi:MAG: hypothetical protein GY732_17625, partial [Gammaproteobacteria bacterium]|nr:hypothetical protein [Gammaproteobacteria bacterium]
MPNNNLDPLASRLKPIVSAVRNSLGVAMLAAPLLVFPDIVEAAIVTDEQVVNSETTGYQRYPSMAMDADGDFVVVWASDGKDSNPDVGDGDGSGIFGQRYNVAGVPQGGEFLVNSYISDYQGRPSVAMDADGDFVVVWHGSGKEDNYGVYGQRFNAAGVPQGSEFLVNSYISDYQRRPSVAMDADGDFVVVWRGSGKEDNDGVHGQRFNAAGVPQGSEFLVNSHTTDYQGRPSVAMDADGDFVVAWEGVGQAGDDSGVYGQRYNASGGAEGNEFLINNYRTDSQYDPSVAMDADGDFVVVWTSYGQDGSDIGIYGQRFNAAGGDEGDEFPINSYTSSYQYGPSVAMDALGNFAVVWESYYTPPDSDDYGVFARTYRASGTPDQSKEFLVNQEVLGNQWSSAVAMDNNGDIAIAWHSHNEDTTPPGRSDYDVILR